MIAFRLVLVLAITLLPGSCAPAPEPTPLPDPDTTTSTSDDAAGMTLTVAASLGAISTTERLQVAITLLRPVGEPVTLTEPDWDAAGWTVIDRADAKPMVLPGDRMERLRTITLEPFLAGDYEVPPVSVAWGEADAERSLTSAPITIEVRSVLPPDDEGELAEAAGAIGPAEPERFDPLLPSIALGVFLLGCAIAWKLTTRPTVRAPREPTPMERLERIAAKPDGHDTAEVHRALESLPPRDRSSVASLIARCERARFGPTDAASTPAAAGDLAAEALRAIRGGTA